MKRIAILLRTVSLGGLALVAAGTLLALTIRDLEPRLAILFYATPWFLRAAGALLAIVGWPRRKSVILISAICLLIAISDGWQSYRSDPPPGTVPLSTVRVSLWNAGRRLNQQPDLWRQQGNADISALVESGPFTPSQFEAFKTANPHHQWRILNKGMMIGVRGSIRSAERIGNGGAFTAFKVQVTLPAHGDFKVIVIDVKSAPWIPRGPSLHKILAETAGDPRFILLGDFNTPAESRWFDEWRAGGLTLANDGPRTGFRETWAYRLPLLTLDQIWTGKHWRCLAATTSLPSGDHDRVEVSLVQAASTPEP